MRFFNCEHVRNLGTLDHEATTAPGRPLASSSARRSGRGYGAKSVSTTVLCPSFVGAPRPPATSCGKARGARHAARRERPFSILDGAGADLGFLPFPVRTRCAAEVEAARWPVPMRRSRPSTFGRKEAQRSGWGNGGCPIRGQSGSGAELGRARWQGCRGDGVPHGSSLTQRSLRSLDSGRLVKIDHFTCPAELTNPASSNELIYIHIRARVGASHTCVPKIPSKLA